MTDLEFALTEAMRPHGEGRVDVAQLRVTAVRRGRRRRQRRVGAVAAACAVLAATVAATVPVLRGQDGEQPAAPTGVPALPRAAEPGAAQKPELVGNDPAVLHFDVDLAGLDAVEAAWDAGGGVESVILWTLPADHFTHWYSLSADRSRLTEDETPDDAPPAESVATTVGDRPAEAVRLRDTHGAGSSHWVITWEPVAGLWAQVKVDATELAKALPAAGRLLLDRSQRCVAPLQVLPHSEDLTDTVSCSIIMSAQFHWSMSTIGLGRRDGAFYEIGIGHISVGDDPFQPTHTVNGRPAQLVVGDASNHLPPGKTLKIPLDSDRILVVQGPYRDYQPARSSVPGRQSVDISDEELLAFAESLYTSADLNDPALWPFRTLA